MITIMYLTAFAACHWSSELPRSRLPLVSQLKCRPIGPDSVQRRFRTLLLLFESPPGLLYDQSVTREAGNAKKMMSLPGGEVKLKLKLKLKVKVRFCCCCCCCCRHRAAGRLQGGVPPASEGLPRLEVQEQETQRGRTRPASPQVHHRLR